MCPFAIEIERKDHIRRPVQSNIVHRKALLSSNVRSVTPPLDWGPVREPRRSEAKRTEGPIDGGLAADRRDRDEPSSREVFSADRVAVPRARDHIFPVK